MGSLSNYIENSVLDHILKTSVFTVPSGLYIGLSTADPTDDGSGIAEPVGNAYARVLHNAWDTAALRATENTGVVTFVEATGSWGTVTHFIVMDAITGGNMIAHGALSASKTIGVGDDASFQDGSIDISYNSGGIATFLADSVLDHIFKVGVYDATANLNCALSLANPTDDGSGLSEPVPGEYVRVVHNTFNVASAGSVTNNGAITFAQCVTAWGTVTHFAMFDAATGGNMLFYGALDASRALGQGDTASFADATLTITMD